MMHWTWAGASLVGSSHLRSELRVQDAFSCFVRSFSGRSVFVGIVSDGAGSAEYGGQGASLVCRCIGVAARKYFSACQELPTRDTIECWVDDVRDNIYRVAQDRCRQPRDFAATLICVFSDGKNSIVAHIGDGCAVMRQAATGRWLAPTWPHHGEYASTTYFITDQPVANLRISSLETPVDFVSVFTDGIERMVLNMATREPSEQFFTAMASPFLKSAVSSGRDGILSRQLKEYLGGEQVRARTDDDVTLVLAALR